MDVADHARAQGAMTPRRTHWALWLGRCRLAFLGASTLVMTLIALV